MNGSRHNLPPALTGFVGRQHELQDVERLLTSARLLTLTGVGGGGKTRLALRLAEVVLDHYPDGVRLVELAALTDPALVPRSVVSALGLPEQIGRPPTETLAAVLRSRDVLLVLDNCEHLIQACADLSDILLRACPRLQIVATSREPLRVPGEVIWRVLPLSVPDADRTLTPEELLAFEAVQLFVNRAEAALPTFALTTRNAAALAQLCHRLDGIPLAIELAAARIPALAVEQIAVRLDTQLGLLTGGSRTALPRHQTLEAALDWSYALLSEPERAALRRLAVFAGGFGLEAAEAVCADSPDPVGIVARLVDKSLVVADRDVDDAVRYRLLEPIRQFALERLVAAGEAVASRQRHLEHFLAEVERAAPGLYGPEQATWLERLDREHDNLRAALTWLTRSVGRTGEAGTAAAGAEPDMRDTEIGLRFGWALMRFWDMRGYLAEGRAWMAALLAADRASGPTAARARALFSAGRLAYEQGDYAAARALSDESLAVAREVDDRECVAFALTQVGHLLRARDELEAARLVYEESLVIRRELAARGAATFRPGVAVSLKCLGGVALARGELVGAFDLYSESLVIERELGHSWEIALSLHRLGEIATELGRRGEARASFCEALAVARDLGDRQNIALALGGVAGLAVADGEPERAVRLLGAADALREAIGCALDPADRARVRRRSTLARRMLADARFDRLHARGRALELDAACAEALAILTSAKVAAMPPHQRLTRREREVACLIARGLTNREIAGALVVAEWTVVNHVRSIMRKLAAGSRAQVAAWAVEHGLTTSESDASPPGVIQSLRVSGRMPEGEFAIRPHVR